MAKIDELIRYLSSNCTRRRYPSGICTTHRCLKRGGALDVGLDNMINPEKATCEEHEIVQILEAVKDMMELFDAESPGEVLASDPRCPDCTHNTTPYDLKPRLCIYHRFERFTGTPSERISVKLDEKGNG